MFNPSLPLMRSSLLAGYNDISHAFSTRKGGMSSPPYSSLNLSSDTGDDLRYVNHNIKALMSALSIESGFLFLNQIHSDNLLLLEDRQVDDGALAYDAVVTNLQKIPLIILTADCLSVLLYDPVNKVIGAVHAGWRGTALGIVEKTVKVMAEKYFSKPEDLIAALGPSIGNCCYEVDDAVFLEFMKMRDSRKEWDFATGATGKKNNGKWMFDLAGANSFQLIKAGLKQRHISPAGICTSCNSDSYFSYRRDGAKTGRQGSIIMLNCIQ